MIQRRAGKKARVLLFLGVFVLVVLANRFSRKLYEANAMGELTTCRNNLKTIGTAMEMYSTDYQGHYPPDLKSLTPRYLEPIPECPAAGTMSYQMEWGPEAPHNTTGFQDYYHLHCSGDSHRDAGIPTGYPEYDGVCSILER